VTWSEGHPLSPSLSWSRGPIVRDAPLQGVMMMQEMSRLVGKGGGGSWIIVTGCERVC
jgi:hypothetical protein